MPLLLFAGKGVSTGRLVSLVTGSEWSHVGMVVVRDGRQLLWEATPDRSIRCDQCKKNHGGVRFMSVIDRLLWPGKVACRRLEGVDVPKRNQLTTLAYDESYTKKNYPSYFDPELWLSAIDFDHPWFLNDEDDGSYFCSELLVRIYREAGLLRSDPGFRSNEFTPGSFSEESDKLPWIDTGANGPRLGSQFMLRS